jgi:hypothetical protein
VKIKKAFKNKTISNFYEIKETKKEIIKTISKYYEIKAKNKN